MEGTAVYKIYTFLQDLINAQLKLSLKWRIMPQIPTQILSDTPNLLVSQVPGS